MKNIIRITINSETENGFVETLKAFVANFTNWEIIIEKNEK